MTTMAHNQSSSERRKTREEVGGGKNDTTDRSEGSSAAVDVPGPSTSASNSNKRELPHNRDTDSIINHEQNIQAQRGESIEEYDQAGLTDTFHGTMYQIKHYMMSVLRALKSKYSFKLAKEMKHAGAFADLVLEYEGQNSSQPIYRFVQLKHQAPDTEKSKITKVDLMNENNADFSLIKYFRSYLEIEKSDKFAKNSIKEYILCTNRDMDVETMENKGIKVDQVEVDDNFLKITDTPKGREPRRYKFKVVDILSDLMESASDMHCLAKVLAKHVCGNKKFTRKPAIFHEYDTFLTTEVINIKFKKFRDDFIDPAKRSNFSDKVKIFRGIFLSQVKKSKEYKVSENKDTFVSEQLNSKFKFSKTFGTGTVTKVPDNEISEEDISKFFGRFIIAVDQPDEQQLTEALSKEMADEFKLNVDFVMNNFQTAILNWFKVPGKCVKPLSETDVQRVLEGIRDEISTVEITGLSLDYKEELNGYNIEFESVDDEVKSFLSVNSESRKLLELSSSTDTLLLALRVHHTIKTVGGYENHDSCMWIKLEQLERPNIRGSVSEAFKRPDRRCLLVVNCGLDGKKESAQILLDPLIESDISGNKKLILLSHETGVSTNDTISFRNLTSQSRRTVLEKPLKFEGSDKSTSLSKLLEIQNLDNLDDNNLNQVSGIMTSDSLVQLIRAKEDKPVIVGSIENEWDGVKDYLYIPRTLCRYETIDSAVFRDSEIEDDFAITGIGEEDWNEVATASTDRRKYILLGDQQPEDDFENHCAKNEVRNIHWLHYSLGKFMWRKTHGDIGKLNKYRSLSDLTDLEEKELQDLLPKDRRTVIIVDVAGTGKSTILTHLAGKIEENGDPSVFLVRINLRHSLNALAKQHESSLQFLVENLSGLREDFEKRVLETMIKRDNNVVVMFDGLDEIESEYQKLVIKLLKELRVRKLFVTTRREMIEDLERCLNNYSYQLKPFVRQHQIDFLCGFWSNRSVAGGRNETSQELSKHAEDVINQLEKSFDNPIKTFLGVPLQTRLVAEVLKDDTEISAKINDVTALFGSFMNKKLEILVDEKSGHDGKQKNEVDKYNNKRLFDDFRRVHQELAMTKLFEEIALKDIRKQPSDMGFAFYAKAGIFTLIKDEVQFNHQTYAEYLAAQFISEFMTDDSRRENAKLKKICEQHILIGDKYRMFRAFLNSFLEKSQPRSIPSATESCKLNLDIHCDEKGRNAYHVAAEEKTVGILKLISSHVVENDNGINSLTKFVQLCEHIPSGMFLNTSYRKALMEHISSPHIIVKLMNGQSPLHVAASIPDNLAVVRFLVENGADVKLNNKHEQTALHVAACLLKNLAVLKFLVENGADVNSQDERKRTSLHVAASRLNNLANVEFLVDNKADVEAEDHEKQTPLHRAVHLPDNLKIVEFLVEKGANIKAEDHEKQTPLHHAVYQPDNLKIVQFLVEKGANIKAEDHEKQTPLHHAVYRSANLEIMNFLVGKGANVNAKDHKERTPLHYAAKDRYCLEIVKFLVGKGADVNAKDHKQRTPLHYAARGQHCLEIVKFLVGEGADVNAKDHEQRTPLHYAQREENSEIVAILRKNEARVDI